MNFVFVIPCVKENSCSFSDIVMCHLMMGILSEKRVIRGFHCNANIIQCTYTNLDSIARYMPRLCGMVYCP